MYKIRDNEHTHMFYKNNRSPLHFLNKEVPQAEYQKQKIQAFYTTNKVAI
jgi:hypothetical protein